MCFFDGFLFLFLYIFTQHNVFCSPYNQPERSIYRRRRAASKNVIWFNKSLTLTTLKFFLAAVYGNQSIPKSRSRGWLDQGQASYQSEN